MTDAEKAIGIAARLYEARRVQRWLLGDAYARMVGDAMAVLRKLAPAHGGVLGALHAALTDMRREVLENAGLGALHAALTDMRREVLENAGLGTLLAAAAAELIEPDWQTLIAAISPAGYTKLHREIWYAYFNDAEIRERHARELAEAKQS